MNRALEKTLYHASFVLGLRKRDVILAAYPKSGSSWVRLLLANVLSLMEMGGETIGLIKLDGLLPELGLSNLLARWPYASIPRVIKTHTAFWPIYRICSRRVLVLRDPRDTVISFYHYELGRKKLRYQGSFSDFVHHSEFGLEMWFRHYVSWRKYATCTVSYERLLASPEEELSKLLESLGLHIDAGIVEKAAERARFDNVRKLEEKHGRYADASRDPMKKEFKFLRSGKSGVWQDSFSSEDLAYYDSLKRRYGVDLY